MLLHLQTNGFVLCYPRQNKSAMNNNSAACPFRCQVIDIIEVAAGVSYLTFERPFDFEAGQVISLTLTDNIAPRLYSIASGVNEPHLGILFDVKPQGILTNLLVKLRKGDYVQVSKPYGSFLGGSEPAVWIATGTGVAPFISMSKSGFAKGKTLIQGARSLDGFYFSNLFEQEDGLSYTRCCSQASAAGIYAGRLTAYLRETPSLPLKEKYYLCGNPLMVNEVRDLLIERGVPYENILSEIFF